jgi:WD40 repeat protein
LSGHSNDIRAVAMAADGRVGVSGSYDGTIRVWDLDHGTCLRTLGDHEGPVYAVSLSADGRRAFSTGRDATLRVWNVQTGNCIHTIRVPSRATSLAVRPDGSAVVSVHADGSVMVWRIVWSLEFPGAASNRGG